jgi:hypothetical protein
VSDSELNPTKNAETTRSPKMSNRRDYVRRFQHRRVLVKK